MPAPRQKLHSISPAPHTPHGVFPSRLPAPAGFVGRHVYRVAPLIWRGLRGAARGSSSTDGGF